MMSCSFTKVDAEKVGKVIGAKEVACEKNHFRIKLDNTEDKRILILEIYTGIKLGETDGVLIVVYTGNSHLQLHNCTGYVISEELGEVTFVAETKQQLSGLVVERGASCSLYASLNRQLISSDFTQLGVEVMLSGVALSLAEEILAKDKDQDS